MEYKNEFYKKKRIKKRQRRMWETEAYGPRSRSTIGWLISTKRYQWNYCVYFEVVSDLVYIYIYIYSCVSYNNWCLYNSIGSHKAFIRWWLQFQAWFWGQSIITNSRERPSSIAQHHQTLSDCCHSMGLPDPGWCS